MRRVGSIALIALFLPLAACSFGGGDDGGDEVSAARRTRSTTSTTFFQLDSSLEVPSYPLDEEDPSATTVAAATATTARRPVATRARVPATTRAPAPPPPPPTTRPTTTTTRGPFCDAFVSQRSVPAGSPVTINVASNFPTSEIQVQVRWEGGASDYSSTTNTNGGWSTTTNASQAAKGKTVTVNARVANRVSCATSFTVT